MTVCKIVMPVCASPCHTAYCIGAAKFGKQTSVNVDYAVGSDVYYLLGQNLPVSRRYHDVGAKFGKRFYAVARNFFKLINGDVVRKCIFFDRAKFRLAACAHFVGLTYARHNRVTAVYCVQRRYAEIGRPEKDYSHFPSVDKRQAHFVGVAKPICSQFVYVEYSGLS